MRKSIILLVTILGIGTVFTLFLVTQRKIRIPETRVSPTVATRPSNDALQFGSIGKGSGAWVQTYDRKTGLPMVRFKAQQYLPQTDGRVKVDHPVADFFVGAGRSQVVRIEGVSGLVVTSGQGPRLKGDLSSTPMQPPSRGEMRDVTVRYFPTQEAMVANKPELTLTLNNAYFDNETYEIATEDYIDENGKTIAGRDVPIRVRGNSFDFDGQGLQVRWDDITQSLKYLKIYRGEQLVIKNPPRSFMPSAKQARAIPGVQPVAPAPLVAARAATPTIGKVYRATFHDGVTVTQAAAQLAAATDMLIDFASREQTDEKAIPRPTEPAQLTVATPAKPAEKQDTTQPDRSDPIIVKWTGELIVVPAPDDPIKPASENDAVVRLMGAPAVLQANGGRLEAANVAYETEHQVAVVQGTPGHPVVMTDSHGSRLMTQSLRYSQKLGTAIMTGASAAEFTTEVAGKPQSLNASWAQRGEVTFDGSADANTITHLQLEGDVKVQHPRIQRFNAGVLAVDFTPVAKDAPKGAKPAIKTLIAKQKVDGVLLNETDKPVAIKCEDLILDMAKGEKTEVYPSRIRATGNVLAGDGKQQIQADSIDAFMSETIATKDANAKDEPKAQLAGLQNLLAVGNVQIRGENGETVQADRVQLKQDGQKSQWVVLDGNPATLSGKNTLLVGKHIELDTVGESALLTGGGRAVLPDASMSASGKGLPVEINWTGDAHLDGSQNLGTLAGNVAMKYASADGALNQAWGDKVEIAMAKRPTTRPQSHKKPGQMSFIADRYAQRLTLLPGDGKEVQVQSLLTLANGTILRQINVFGPRLDCLLSPGGLENFTVPGSAAKPGRMLYVALPPATKKAVNVDDPLKAGSLKGTTAFAWRDKMVYDRSTSQFVMTGDVLIRHRPQAKDGLPFEVNASTVTADIVKPASAKPATASAPIEALEVSQITLTGSPVTIARSDMNIAAPTVEIFPGTSTVAAKGNERSPVQYEKNQSTGTATELYINTQTQKVVIIGASATGRQ